jgi:hypothetical protein
MDVFESPDTLEQNKAEKPDSPSLLAERGPGGEVRFTVLIC